MSDHHPDDNIHVTILAHQRSKLREICHAINGLSDIQQKALREQSQPEWWSEYQDSAVTDAIHICADSMASIVDSLDEQAFRALDGAKS